MSEIDPFLIHGVAMWIIWFVMSQVQLCTHRYLKGRLWKHAFCIHATCGTMIYLCTFAMAMYALKECGFEFVKNVHYWFVFPVWNLTLFIVIFGCVAKRKGQK